MNIGKINLGKSPTVAVSFRGGVSAGTIAGVRRDGIKLAELRIDLFKRLDSPHVLNEIKRYKGFVRIATIRSRKEGGKAHLSEKERLTLFRAILPLVEAIDVELSSKTILRDLVAEARRRKKCIIISYHNFKKMPALSELQKIVNKSLLAGASIVKIAAMARRTEDLKIITELTLENKKKNIITIAMGEKGAASRVFLPVIGSLLAYAHVGKVTAPGQLDHRTMLSLLGNITF